MRSVPNPERKEQAVRSLEVGLADKLGQQRLAGFPADGSREFPCPGSEQPVLILADEPTGALDSRTSKGCTRFYERTRQEGNTIVMITLDRFIAMEAGVLSDT